MDNLFGDVTPEEKNNLFADISEEEKSSLTNYVSSGKEVGLGEAVARGAGEGITAGFSDELAGVGGAITDLATESLSVGPKREALKSKYEQILDKYKQVTPRDANHKQRIESLLGSTQRNLRSLEDQPDLDFSDAYKESRDEYRQDTKQAVDQHPIAFTAGALGGGMAVPGGAGVFKRADNFILDALKIGAVGTALGGLAGAGMSEADLIEAYENPEKAPEIRGEFIDDIKQGTKLGAATSLLIPAGAGVLATGRAIKGTNAWQRGQKAYERAKRGEKVVGSEAEKDAINKMADVSKQTNQDLQSLKSSKWKKIEELEKKAAEEGKTVEFRDLMLRLREEASDLTKSNVPATRQNAEEFLEVVDTWLRGDKKIIGHAGVSGATAEQKAMEKLAQKRAQLLAKVKAEGQVPAIEGVKKSGAQTIKKAEAKRAAEIDKLLQNEGIDSSKLPTLRDKEEALNGLYGEKGAMEEIQKKLTRVPEFDDPRLVTEAQTGKRVIEMVDSDTGQSINKSMDDMSISDIKEVTDPFTHKRYFEFVDEGSGKSYRTPINEDTVSKIKPIMGRAGANTDLSVKDAKRFKKDLQSYTPVQGGQLVKDAASPEIQELALRGIKGKSNDAGEKIMSGVDDLIEKATPGMKEANQAYSNVAKTISRLGLDDQPDIPEIMERVGQSIMKVAKETETGMYHKKIMDIIFEELAETDPTTAVKIKDRLYDAAEQLDLAFGNKAPSIITGTSGNTSFRTGIEQVPVHTGAAAGRVVHSLQKIAQNSPEMLKTIASGLHKVSTKPAMELANILRTAAERNQSGRKALIFGIMQNPEYRKILEENNVSLEENRDEPGR